MAPIASTTNRAICIADVYNSGCNCMMGGRESISIRIIIIELVAIDVMLRPKGDKSS